MDSDSKEVNEENFTTFSRVNDNCLSILRDDDEVAYSLSINKITEMIINFELRAKDEIYKADDMGIDDIRDFINSVLISNDESMMSYQGFSVIALVNIICTPDEEEIKITISKNGINETLTLILSVEKDNFNNCLKLSFRKCQPDEIIISKALSPLRLIISDLLEDFEAMKQDMNLTDPTLLKQQSQKLSIASVDSKKDCPEQTHGCINQIKKVVIDLNTLKQEMSVMKETFNIIKSRSNTVQDTRGDYKSTKTVNQRISHLKNYDSRRFDLKDMLDISQIHVNMGNSQNETEIQLKKSEVKRKCKLTDQKFAVYCLIELQAQIMLIAGEHRSIFVHHLKNERTFEVQKAHIKACTSLVKLSGTSFVSGGVDKLVKVWKSTNNGDQNVNFACLFIFDQHAGSILCLEFHSQTKFISGSEDSTIKIWDIETKCCLTQAFFKRCVSTIRGHSKAVNCLHKLGKDLVASGGADQQVKIWRISDSKCISTFSGIFESVNYIIQISKTIIAVASDSDFICLLDIIKGECTKIMYGHALPVKCLKAYNSDILISVSEDKSIKIWNCNSATCTRTITGFANSLNSLCILNDQTFVCCEDGQLHFAK